MKFLVDANLPYTLVKFLITRSHEAIYVRDLPNGDFLTDKEIITFSKEQDCVVITKDSDFLHNHLVDGFPKKLLKVNTGNISNKQLIELLEKNFNIIENCRKEYFCFSIDTDYIYEL